jgi:hypothetical protein
MLIGAVTIFSLLTLAMAFTDSIAVFGILRFLAGVGLGHAEQSGGRHGRAGGGREAEARVLDHGRHDRTQHDGITVNRPASRGSEPRIALREGDTTVPAETPVNQVLRGRAWVRHSDSRCRRRAVFSAG